MKKIFLLLIVALGYSFAGFSGAGSHGGHGYCIPDNASNKCYLYELWEIGSHLEEDLYKEFSEAPQTTPLFYGKLFSALSGKLTPELSDKTQYFFNRIYNRLLRQAPAVAHLLDISVFNYNFIAIDKELKRTGDFKVITSDYNPKYHVQAAARHLAQVRFSIPVIEKMGPANLAFTIIHELIYPYQLIQNEEEDFSNRPTMDLVAQIASGHFFRLSPQSIRNSSFLGFNVHQESLLSESSHLSFGRDPSFGYYVFKPMESFVSLHYSDDEFVQIDWNPNQEDYEFAMAKACVVIENKIRELKWVRSWTRFSIFGFRLDLNNLKKIQSKEFISSERVRIGELEGLSGKKCIELLAYRKHKIENLKNRNSAD